MPYRPKKMYINLGKFFSKRNQDQGWIVTGNYYDPACLIVRADHNGGYGINTSVGRLTITWYVKFRGLVPV